MAPNDVQLVIDAGWDAAAARFQTISEERQRELGIPVEKLLPFLYTLHQLDREKRKKDHEEREKKKGKNIDKGKERYGLASIMGIRELKRPLYYDASRGIRDEYKDASPAKKLRKRKWGEYGVDIVLEFEGNITKYKRVFAKKCLSTRNEVLEDLFERKMRGMFRSDEDVIKHRQPKYDDILFQTGDNSPK